MHECSWARTFASSLGGFKPRAAMSRVASAALARWSSRSVRVGLTTFYWGSLGRSIRIPFASMGGSRIHARSRGVSNVMRTRTGRLFWVWSIRPGLDLRDAMLVLIARENSLCSSRKCGETGPSGGRREVMQGVSHGSSGVGRRLCSLPFSVREALRRAATVRLREMSGA